MTNDSDDVSIVTAAAIALGVMKGTSIVRQLGLDVGIDKPPAQLKQLLATGLAIYGAVVFEHGFRRRALTAVTAAGLSSLLHTAERAMRMRGDVDGVSIMQVLSGPQSVADAIRMGVPKSER